MCTGFTTTLRAMESRIVEKNTTGDEVAAYVSSNSGSRVDIIVRDAILDSHATTTELGKGSHADQGDLRVTRRSLEFRRVLGPNC